MLKSSVNKKKYQQPPIGQVNIAIIVFMATVLPARNDVNLENKKG